jgi:RsiW-degrading membrane proteinase PrsW (M82 family)
VLWILIPGLLIALGISVWRGKEIDSPSLSRWLPEEAKISSRAECVRLLEQTRLRQRKMEVLLHTDKHSDEQPDASNLSGAETFLRPDERELYYLYKLKMEFFTGVQPDDIEPFAKAAALDPVSGFICSMHGDLLRASRKYEPALAVYERGAGDPETGPDCARRALDMCHRMGWTAKLRSLYERPGWRDAVLDSDRRYDSTSDDVAAAAGDWKGMLVISWKDLKGSLRHPEWVVMSAMAGLIWFLVIHMGACVPVRLWWRGLLGFGLGVMSIPLTLFLITAEQNWFGVQSSFDNPDIIYCISGIGLREETAKLVLFVPMLFLLRKAQAAHVLAVAASVGLGFAVEENINYFAGGSDVWVRFISANFLHFALTGLTGLALWQTVRNSKWLPHFAWIFVGAVMYHGLYDFHPQDARLAGDYGYFIYVGLAVLAV